MRTLTIAFGLAVLLGANGSALAQLMGTTQEQAACSRDAQRFCQRVWRRTLQGSVSPSRSVLSELVLQKTLKSHGMWYELPAYARSSILFCALAKTE